MQINGMLDYGKEHSSPRELPWQVSTIPVLIHSHTKNGSLQITELQDLSPGGHVIVVSRLSKESGLEAESQLQVFVPKPPPWWYFLRLPTELLFFFLLVAFLWWRRTTGS